MYNFVLTIYLLNSHSQSSDQRHTVYRKESFYHCVSRFRTIPYRGTTSSCALDVSFCVLLPLFGLSRVSPHRYRLHATCGGEDATTESACAVHPILLSFFYSHVVSFGSDPTMVSREYRRTSSTSTAIIATIHPKRQLFPPTDADISLQHIARRLRIKN